VIQLVGKGVDVAAARLPAMQQSDEDPVVESPRREQLLAAVNGLMGDQLVETENPFATPMTLRYRGEALDLEGLPACLESADKVVLLIHGLGMNDLQWVRGPGEGEGADYGGVLHAEQGYEPIYLRYNSGLHISINGRELAHLLEELVTRWPCRIEDLSVVAHSMGGLVIRSACHYAGQEDLTWPNSLKNIVFLGTPHHGAPLEKVGNWVDVLLGSTPFSAPFAKLGQLRSSGVTDLRYGHIVDDDWESRDRFARSPDRRQVVPLPQGVACFTVAATMASGRSMLADRLVGDGLVPVNSALGHHDERRKILDFPETSRWIASRTKHIELLSNPAVISKVAQWLDSSGR
jgi:pimeloyl-ACP methyl ester carboxylesterase